MATKKFAWDKSLAVGISTVDEQHKIWIERLNTLAEVIDSKQEAAHITKTLNFMMAYIEFHFSAEESLMEMHKYHRLPQHQAEHQHFREAVMDLLALKMEQPGAVRQLADSINHFQIRWLKNHIQEADRQFAEYLHGTKVLA